MAVREAYAFAFGQIIKIISPKTSPDQYSRTYNLQPSTYNFQFTVYPATARRFRLPESRLQAESKKRETLNTLNLQCRSVNLGGSP